MHIVVKACGGQAGERQSADREAAFWRADVPACLLYPPTVSCQSAEAPGAQPGHPAAGSPIPPWPCLRPSLAPNHVPCFRQT